MKISLVVPSYKRITFLNECLQAIEKQAVYPYEIIVVLRDDDEESRRKIKHIRNLKMTFVSKPGLIMALNKGLQEATGDIIAFTDDDAEPFADWIEKITNAFESNEKLGGYGGRDVIIVDGKEVRGKTKKIGIIQWFGRQIDSHHLELDPPRQIKVDLLKGVNMAFRRSLLDGFKFDETMNNKTTYCNEYLICFWVRKKGGILIYDPELKVFHKTAQLKMGVQRGEDYAVFEYAHNYTYVMLKHLSWLRKIIFLAYYIVIGERKLPGPVLLIIGCLAEEKASFSRFIIAEKGKFAGLMTWWKTRLHE